MARKKWGELNPRARRWILAGALFEALLKIAALIDLARRPAGEIRGSKLRWALSILLVNSLGALPITYFARGRRRS